MRHRFLRTLRDGFFQFAGKRCFRKLKTQYFVWPGNDMSCKRRSETETIGLFIVGKSEELRERIRQATDADSDIQILGESDPNVDAYNRICAAYPRVLLIESTTPSHFAIELAQRIATDLPQTAIIIATLSYTDSELFEVTMSGASAYIRKDSTPSELIASIRRVADGEYLLTEHFITNPGVLERSVRHFYTLLHKEDELDPVDKFLSKREREVLAYVACGYANKKIARCLSLKPSTINNHTTAILRKLDVPNRTEAVLKAIEHGWISASTVCNPPRP